MIKFFKQLNLPFWCQERAYVPRSVQDQVTPTDLTWNLGQTTLHYSIRLVKNLLQHNNFTNPTELHS